MGSLLWLGPTALIAVVGLVIVARLVRESPGVQDFLATYPGQATLPQGTPVGFPAWLAWQHFLNAFLLLLIVRTGWQVRTQTRPGAYWTPRNRKSGSNASARISLALWLHHALDVVWVLNGVLFFILLFATGQWARIVPVSWDVFPHALSTALQYASFHWPTENGWVNYNALQLLAYFVTVFIAAPLAIATGLRMSPLWAGPLRKLDRVYPVALARRIHLPVMIYFVVFTAAHVTLVLSTGALRNLNHMYGGRDDHSWWGVGMFAVSVVVMIAGWLAMRPVLIRALAARTGTVSR